MLVASLRAQGRSREWWCAPTRSASAHSRKMVLEFLASSVDLSTAPEAQRYCARYGADPSRYGQYAETVEQPVENRQQPCTCATIRSAFSATSASKRAERDAQNTFAIAAAGRGFDAHISTEYDVAAARFGLRVLRQLHRRLSDRRADVFVGTRDARRRHVGRIAPNAGRYDLPVLRRRLHAAPQRPGRTKSSRSPRRSKTASRTAASASKAGSEPSYVHNRDDAAGVVRRG